MNIFVGNLSPITIADSLRILFSEFGEVVSSKVIMDNATGTSRGFGFVEMAEKNAAQDAIDNLDVSFFEGNIISVKEAKQSTTGGRPGASSSPGGRPFRPRTPRPGGYTPRPGGYNNSGSSSSSSGDRYNRNYNSTNYNSNNNTNYNSNSNNNNSNNNDNFNRNY